MNTPRFNAELDRYTQMADIAMSVRRMLARLNTTLAVILGIGAGYLIASDRPGAIGLVLMAVGTYVALSVWRNQGLGLPMVPMLVAQHLVAYGLPILVGHQTLSEYPEDFTTRAGLEVMIFDCCLAAGFSFSMQVFRPSSGYSYALDDASARGTAGLGRLGFTLITIATIYQLAQSASLMGIVYDLLPSGTYSIFTAVAAATSACGFFLASMVISAPETPAWKRLVFWLLLTVNCLITASSFLLSSTTTIVVSVVIGIFWSTGRIPWRYLVVVVGILAFLNLGKFTMRERYWKTGNEDTIPQFNLAALPVHYAEWFEASFSNIGGGEDPSTPFKKEKRKGGQSLFERVNNLQNLLYVMDAMEGGKVPPLMGSTYALIPPLLVPRILWPDKPRSHEGQVMLAVHFGRQDLSSTFQTYIAWGLLPEAYGNFGPIVGAVILGCCAGFIFGWIENLTSRKPVLSMEGFVAFTVFLAMVSSYEMVASVLVTSTFQAIIPVVAASLPFTRRMLVERPPPETDEASEPASPTPSE